LTNRRRDCLCSCTTRRSLFHMYARYFRARFIYLWIALRMITYLFLWQGFLPWTDAIPTGRVASLPTASVHFSLRGTRLPRLPKEVAVRRLLLAFAISILAVESASGVSAAKRPGEGGTPPPQAVAGSLKAVPVPVPDGVADFIANKDAVIALGKSLFW